MSKNTEQRIVCCQKTRVGFSINHSTWKKILSARLSISLEVSSTFLTPNEQYLKVLNLDLLSPFILALDSFCSKPILQQ
ncbi:hypothetical protein M0R45_025049 [Rubus argutus]|uniref:Uncharacterized protein n=1 Tax=Rubus argutus TaxID=59490 RepID=A0AAW1WTL7_RUBAR